jgi:C4-dicarboxylate-specific signal transduction histidine kinase
MRRLDGNHVDVLFTACNLPTAMRAGTVLVGIIDLSERNRAQYMLQQLQADFAHAARVSMLGELTASIAHELNQPLAAIATSGEACLRWLDRPQPDVEEVRASNQRMLIDARRASDIISRVRAMATRRGPERTPLLLDDVIREALLFLRHEVQAHHVTVSQHIDPRVPQVLADRTQLQQVIVNLAVNAMRAMEQAGTADRRLNFRTCAPDEATVLCIVEDSGPGIALEHQPHLFDSFFTTKDCGLGMGLSICRSIIEAHGGRITAENQAGQGGARLCFTLPANGAPE